MLSQVFILNYIFCLRCVCDLCVTLTRCVAADGVCCHLPRLPLLTVSNKHAHAHTNMRKHTHMHKHAESTIVPLEGSSAQDIAM